MDGDGEVKAIGRFPWGFQGIKMIGVLGFMEVAIRRRETRGDPTAHVYVTMDVCICR